MHRKYSVIYAGYRYMMENELAWPTDQFGHLFDHFSQVSTTETGEYGNTT